MCLFRLAGSSFCPDCATAGPSAEERSKVFSGGLLSLGLAVIGFGITAGLMVAGASGVTMSKGVDVLISPIWLACSIGGLAAGLSSREGARRTGSLLPMIGTVASGLLMALQLVFIVIGQSR